MNQVTKEVINISLRESRKKELREDIYTQALTLFRERGYDNVTIEDITTACGIAKGTFYNYFPKKEHILLHLGKAQMKTLENSFSRHQEVKPVRERIRLIFRDLFARLDLEPELLKSTLLKMLRSSIFEHEQKLINKMKLMWEPLFKEAIDTGEISGRWEPERLSAVFVGLYFNTIFDWLNNPVKEDMLTIFYTSMDMLWFGIERERGDMHE